MNILIVSATIFEIAPLTGLLEQHYEQVDKFHFRQGDKNIYILITGVGMTATAFALGSVLTNEDFIDVAFNFGIAGAYNRDLKIGDVVHVASERFGDLGVEEANGDFVDLFELGLQEREVFPFQNGQMLHPLTDFDLLPSVNGLTVNKVSGTAKRIEAITKKYHADIETMEGAGFFYGCLQAKIRFFEVRAISNYVEPRNRENWNLPLAIDNLNAVAWGLVNAYED